MFAQTNEKCRKSVFAKDTTEWHGKTLKQDHVDHSQDALTYLTTLPTLDKQKILSKLKANNLNLIGIGCTRSPKWTALHTV